VPVTVARDSVRHLGGDRPVLGEGLGAWIEAECPGRRRPISASGPDVAFRILAQPAAHPHHLGWWCKGLHLLGTRVGHAEDRIAGWGATDLLRHVEVDLAVARSVDAVAPRDLSFGIVNDEVGDAAVGRI